jgi:sec-independent protein translocase protein TatA
MSNFKGWEIIIVLALLLLLFGAKRLPDAARGLGRSLRIFKAETKGLRDDDERDRQLEGRRVDERRVDERDRQLDERRVVEQNRRVDETDATEHRTER